MQSIFNFKNLRILKLLYHSHKTLIVGSFFYHLLSLELVLFGCQSIMTINFSEWKT